MREAVKLALSKRELREDCLNKDTTHAKDRAVDRALVVVKS